MVGGRAGWRAGLLLAAAVALGGCQTYYRTDVERAGPQPEVVQSALRYQKEYILFAGDQIEVLVWRVPEASRTVVIRSDGKISLPIVQDVEAAGLTPRELAARLRELLGARLLNPEVAVIPIQVRQPSVYVLGDVKAPATVPYRNAPNLLQALSAAGGVARSGSEQYVTIIRLEPDGYVRAIPVDVGAYGQAGPYLAFATTPLQPDDVVFVPETGRSQVQRFVDDFILKPTAIIVNYKLYQTL